MTKSQLKEFNGVVLVPERSSQVIRARDLDAAKAQMEKQHGPEFDGEVKRWVCGLTPDSHRAAHPA